MIRKIVKKSAAFWRHGKHAKIPPPLLQAPRRPRRVDELFASVEELMRRTKRGRTA